MSMPTLRFHSPAPAASRRIRAIPKSAILALLTFLPGVIPICARPEPLELSPAQITLPAGANAPLFADIDGSGRCALLVIDPVARTLWNFRQTPAGFSRAPDQIIPLPPETLWVAVGDIDAHPGRELLMSTATGAFYSRQDAGRFETERHTLISAHQDFTHCDEPPLTMMGTNAAIPIVSGKEVVWYHRNPADEWSPGSAEKLESNPAAWSLDPEFWYGSWALDGHPAHKLRVQQSWQAKSAAPEKPDLENDAIRKIVASMKKTAHANPPEVEYGDFDGDGRPDAVVWQVSGFPDYRTDLYLFLSSLNRSPAPGAGDAKLQLPVEPTEVLHCRGLPIPMGSSRHWSPLHDLHGDGIDELVLIEFKTSVLSYGGLLEAVLSHGLDWALTVRTLHHDGFSHSPDGSVPVTAFLPGEAIGGWPFFFQGDFNGDGRPDLVVRRSDTRWDIICSTTDGRWFDPQPAFALTVPPQGYVEIKDLNGDGLSDFIWHELDRPELLIFMSPSPPPKDKHP